MYSYPHMCRMDHEEIGHRDSEHEECPLCRANNEIAALREERERRYTVEEVTAWLSEYHGKYREIQMTEWVRARRALKERP